MRRGPTVAFLLNMLNPADQEHTVEKRGSVAAYSLQQRVLSYFLMAVMVPCVLFTWVLLFGAQSYQEWNDRFTYELTNRYLFAQAQVGTILGPLWREDILSGSVWATNKAPAPFSVQIVAARLFDLSPAWVELVGNAVLYLVAVISMYVYVRRELLFGIESATATAAMFGGTAYWLSFWVGNPDLSMPAAWIPALLVLAHHVERAAERRHPAAIAISTIALALAFYACALHSVLASLPVAPMIVMAYAWFVFGARPAVLWIAAGLGVGLLLYSPFMWSVIEATRLSSRYVGAGFLNPHDLPFDPSRWLTNARIMLSQIAVGHNQFGLYLMAVLGGVAWWCLGSSWREESPRVRKILMFAVAASGALVVMGIFDVTIDYLKMWVPLFGAWHVKRFEHFMFLPVLMLAGWMLDRSLFSRGGEVEPRKRFVTFQGAIVCVVALGFLQIGYSAYRMRFVPDSIHPQNLILFSYLLLYAVCVTVLLTVLYRNTLRRSGHDRLALTERTRMLCLTLIVLSVALVVSIHTYRAAVLPPKVGVAGTADQIMTYAERYAVPSDLATLKEMNHVDARVVDLTRPWYPDTLGPASETTLLPLAGLRTPSGYNFAPTRWYERFISLGINGTSSDLQYIIQIRNAAETNFEALGLLNVGYILAEQGARLPGYKPIRTMEPDGKTIYAAADDSLVSHAFLASGVICFSRDEEALAYIRHRGIRELRARVVLISSDAGVGQVCNNSQALRNNEMALVPVHTHREQDRIRMEVDSPSEAVLTLADSYYPGWHVSVDGVEKPLLRTYTALRGVAVEPGHHVIEFVYLPLTFELLYRFSNGLLLLLLTVALVAWGVKRVHPATQRAWEAAQ
jgi:hypothetical protein